MEMLLRVLARHPHDRDTLGALVAYSQEQGNPRQAPSYDRRLAELDPVDPQLRQIVERREIVGDIKALSQTPDDPSPQRRRGQTPGDPSPQRRQDLVFLRLGPEDSSGW